MARANVRRRHSDLPHFESVARISSLPIVESGIHIAGNVYRKIKVLLQIMLHVHDEEFRHVIKTGKFRFRRNSNTAAVEIFPNAISIRSIIMRTM